MRLDTMLIAGLSVALAGSLGWALSLRSALHDATADGSDAECECPDAEPCPSYRQTYGSPSWRAVRAEDTGPPARAADGAVDGGDIDDLVDAEVEARLDEKREELYERRREAMLDRLDEVADRYALEDEEYDEVATIFEEAVARMMALHDAIESGDVEMPFVRGETRTIRSDILEDLAEIVGVEEAQQLLNETLPPQGGGQNPQGRPQGGVPPAGGQGGPVQGPPQGGPGGQPRPRGR